MVRPFWDELDQPLRRRLATELKTYNYLADGADDDELTLEALITWVKVLIWIAPEEPPEPRSSSAFIVASAGLPGLGKRR